MESAYVAPAPIQWTADGTALASSTTLTTISPAPDYIIGANQLRLGSIIRVKARGRYGTTATPTLKVGLYYGLVAGVDLADTGAVTMPSTVTNQAWEAEFEFTVRSLGTSGTAMCIGRFVFSTGATASQIAFAPQTAPVVATINTTTANALELGATWGTSNAANTIQVHQQIIELVL